jgi:hypothetical protein
MNNCYNCENLGLILAVWLVGDFSENTVLYIQVRTCSGKHSV